MEETPEHQLEPVLEPVEQHTIMFYGKPLVIVRLPNGEPGIVLSHFCSNLQLDVTGQINRVKRKKALADGLHYARIQTPGGPQVLAVLTLRVTPGWLFGIDVNRARPEMRPEIERYQVECVDVLYQWAATSQLSASTSLVPAKPITEPVAPGKGATLAEWKIYYEQMAEFTDWRITVEEWRGSVEGRLESIEALIPDILDRLPSPTITPAHQNQVKYFVSQLSKATNKPPATIYSSLYTAFRVPRYTELREDEWEQIERWFQTQIDRVKKMDTEREQKASQQSLDFSS